jgi:hypothetical protein
MYTYNMKNYYVNYISASVNTVYKKIREYIYKIVNINTFYYTSFKDT